MNPNSVESDHSLLHEFIRLKRPYAGIKQVYIHVKLHPQLVDNVMRFTNRVGITQTDFFTFLLEDAATYFHEGSYNFAQAARMPPRSWGAIYFQMRVPVAVQVSMVRWRKLFFLTYTDIITYILTEFSKGHGYPVPGPLPKEEKRKRKNASKNSGVVRKMEPEIFKEKEDRHLSGG